MRDAISIAAWTPADHAQAELTENARRHLLEQLTFFGLEVDRAAREGNVLSTCGKYDGVIQCHVGIVGRARYQLSARFIFLQFLEHLRRDLDWHHQTNTYMGGLFPVGLAVTESIGRGSKWIR